MFISLLHERKIIIIHNDASKNAILIETLISLLYPLQWNFTNISYMIPSMIDYLEAPFPYIIGVPRPLWDEIHQSKWDSLGEEVIAFDIDRQKVFKKEELLPFPEPYTKLLINNLESQIKKSKEKEMSEEPEEEFWNTFTLRVK